MSAADWVPASHIVARPIKNGAMLLDLNNGGCWQLNASGAALWSALANARSLAEAIDEVAAGLEHPREKVEADMLRFAEDLAEAGMLVRRSPSDTPGGEPGGPATPGG